MIQVIDNFLSEEEFNFVFNYSRSALYKYGEIDDLYGHPQGVVHNIKRCKTSCSEEDYDLCPKISLLFENKLKEFVPNHKLYRMYINCFAQSENPYFHIDSGSGTDQDEITFLYYAEESWNLDDGGETQFFIDGRIYGVFPIPNRLVYFNANLVHRATCFRDRHRFTFALKYDIESSDRW